MVFKLVCIIDKIIKGNRNGRLNGEIMKNVDFMKGQRESIFNDMQWATYKANYNQAHAMDKCKVSFTKYVNNLVYTMRDTERVTNQNVADLVNLAKWLLVAEKFERFETLTQNGFNFKVSVAEFIASTKKVGVITERDGDTKSQKIGLKVARGERILRDLFLTLLSDELITKIESKKEGKQASKKASKQASKKAKKTTSKK